MIKKNKVLLLIFIATFLTRIIIAFLIPGFTYESYFHLRQVENIVDTGVPLYNDDLSYGGRDHLFLPLFHYIAALFSFVFPLEIVAKILPNLFVATLTLSTYMISKRITNNHRASLISSFIAGFLPILFSPNSFTVETLSIPLTFFVIYTFFEMSSNSSKNTPKSPIQIATAYALLFLALTFTSSAAALLLGGFLIYIFLSFVEGKKINKLELEMILFSLFFFIWAQLLFFKKILLELGPSFIWQNIPSEILSQYFPQLSLLQIIILVSVLPFLAGVFVVYRSLFTLKNQKSFLLISFTISTTILVWMRLIPLRISLSFFSVVVAILFAQFYCDLISYLKKTKITVLQKGVLPLILVLLIISTMIPAINTALKQDTPTKEEIAAFSWLATNTPPKTHVVAQLKEGHLIAYYGKRKNLIDDQFRNGIDVNTRFRDLDFIFTTPFQTQALGLSDQYQLGYFVFSSSSREEYNISKFKYATKSCFEPLYDNESTVYQRVCELKESNYEQG